MDKHQIAALVVGIVFMTRTRAEGGRFDYTDRVRTVELPVSDGMRDDEVIAHVESQATSAGLEIGSKGTLKSYPGCTHWHFNRAGEKGTLEATWYPAKRRLWLKVQAGRESAWIDDAISVFKSLVDSWAAGS